MGQGPAQGHTGSTAEAGELAQGAGLHPGPCRPHPAPPGHSRDEEGPLQPSAPPGTQVPFSCGEKADRLSAGTAGLCLLSCGSAPAAGRTIPAVSGDQEPTEAPWPRPRNRGGLRWGPREPLLQGPHFLSQPETGAALPRPGSPESSGRGAAGCEGRAHPLSRASLSPGAGSYEQQVQTAVGWLPPQPPPRSSSCGFQALGVSAAGGKEGGEQPAWVGSRPGPHGGT